MLKFLAGDVDIFAGYEPLCAFAEDSLVHKWKLFILTLSPLFLRVG